MCLQKDRLSAQLLETFSGHAGEVQANVGVANAGVNWVMGGEVDLTR